MVVGVITDDQDRVLIQQRTDGPFAGQWEFPGGKRESGESSFDALRRELREENGIEVVRASPLIHITHRYPDRAVSLRTFFIDRYTGTPSGAEGQAVRWVSRRELFGQTMLAADRPLSVATNLPHQYFMTSPIASEREVPVFLDALDAALSQDVRLMCLRAPQLSTDSYARLARLVAARCRSNGTELLLHGERSRVPLVREVGAGGLHMPSMLARKLAARPVDADLWFAVSTRTADDLARACDIEADFATLDSALLASALPGADTLDWSEFRACVADALVPVYARGGLTPADAAQSRAQGGQGVTVETVWTAARRD